MTTDDAWDALVGTAVLGTSRRPLDVAALPVPVARELGRIQDQDQERSRTAETGQPGRLLDAAALLAVYLRAGKQVSALPPGWTRPDPAPPADSRPVPAVASNRLGDLVADVSGQASGLLLIWLGIAAARGFQAPAEHLPALLRLATRNPEIRAAVLPVLGPRGLWLARQNPEWARLVPATPSLPAPPAPVTSGDPATGHDPAAGDAADDAADDAAGGDPAADPAWTHGSLTERREFFAGLRRRDPDGARDLLLASSWMSNDGPARAAFTAELAGQLSDRDAPLLELALADRRQDVRGIAAGLLAQLPNSDYVRRLTAIAQGCLRVQRVALRRTLVIRLPDPEQDLPPLPPLPAWLPDRSQAGPGAQLLLRVLAVVPLRRWEEWLSAAPKDLLQLPVSDGLRGIVHAGWSAAAQRQHDAAWAAALITEHGGAVAEHLLAEVPPTGRAALAGAALVTPGQGTRATVVQAMLRLCPQPWPAALVTAVLTWLSVATNHGQPWAARDLLGYLGQSLPPDPATLAGVHALAAQFPPGHPWHEAFTAVAGTLLHHRQMLEELR